MRVLVVVPRFVPTPGDYYSFPLGLAYITSALKQAGHQVFGLNLNHRIGETKELVADAVRTFGAEVCASGSLSPYLPEVKRIFLGARNGNNHIVNIAGGGVVSSDPEVSPQIMDIDYGVVGEGEITICELLDILQRGSDPGKCKGIVFRNRKGEIVETESRPSVMDLSEFAWPDYETLGFSECLHLRRPLDNNLLQAHNNNAPRAIDMISSRSCPYSCTFCFHPVGKVYRERPLDEFFAELETLIAKYQINGVGILDELFSLRRARLLEFCERIKPLGLSWLVQLHTHSVDKEVLAAMSGAGCSFISYGIESMNQKVLISMQKKSKRERIETTLQQTYDAKLGIMGNLIFGDSAETLETANDTMSWWAHNRNYQISLSRLGVYPGSPDYIVAVRDGMIPDRAVYANELPIYLNISNMNDANLDGITFQAFLHQQTLLNIAPVMKFARSKQQIEGRDTAYDFKWRCPRCDHVNSYEQCVLNDEHQKSILVFCRSCRSRSDIQNLVAYDKVSDGILSLEGVKKRVRSLLENTSKLVQAHAFEKHQDPIEELRNAGREVGDDPFEPARHARFADALEAIGAIGAARLHFEQAVSLAPRSAEFADKLATLKRRPDYAEKCETYFVSFSDAPPAYRRSREVASYDRKREPAFPVYSRAGNRTVAPSALHFPYAKLPSVPSLQSMQCSGIWNDGWMAESAVMRLARRTQPARFVVAGMMPWNPKTLGVSQLVVRIDGVEKARHSLTQGPFFIPMNLEPSEKPIWVEIQADGAIPLGSGDHRSVSVRLTRIGWSDSGQTFPLEFRPTPETVASVDPIGLWTDGWSATRSELTLASGGDGILTIKGMIPNLKYQFATKLAVTANETQIGTITIVPGDVAVQFPVPASVMPRRIVLDFADGQGLPSPDDRSVGMMVHAISLSAAAS